MKARAFAICVAPSVVAMLMLMLIAVPLVGVVYLAVTQSHVKSHLVQVTTTVPLFGGLSREETTTVSQAVLDKNGDPIQVWQYVGAKNLDSALDLDGMGRLVSGEHRFTSLRDFFGQLQDEIASSDFWSALEFTLILVFVSTPAVLVIGLALALAVNRMTGRARSAMITVSLLPTLVAPLVSSMAIFWLFMDGSLIPSLLQALGLPHFYFLANRMTARLLLIGYEIWFATPFSFILLFAGLQTLPRDLIEAAVVDGASKWQRVRLIVIPHLAPIFAVITMIHMMDAYRIFEPILVFGTRAFANSVQYLTYFALVNENDVHKAAAYAILTTFGVIVLLIPITVSTWREQRRTK